MYIFCKFVIFICWFYLICKYVLCRLCATKVTRTLIGRKRYQKFCFSLALSLLSLPLCGIVSVRIYVIISDDIYCRLIGLLVSWDLFLKYNRLSNTATTYYYYYYYYYLFYFFFH